MGQKSEAGHVLAAIRLATLALAARPAGAVSPFPARVRLLVGDADMGTAVAGIPPLADVWQPTGASGEALGIAARVDRGADGRPLALEFPGQAELEAAFAGASQMDPCSWEPPSFSRERAEDRPALAFDIIEGAA